MMVRLPLVLAGIPRPPTTTLVAVAAITGAAEAAAVGPASSPASVLALWEAICGIAVLAMAGTVTGTGW